MQFYEYIHLEHLTYLYNYIYTLTNTNITTEIGSDINFRRFWFENLDLTNIWPHFYGVLMIQIIHFILMCIFKEDLTKFIKEITLKLMNI